MPVLTLKQSTVENFVAATTRRTMIWHARLSEKRNKLIDSVPLLKKTRDRINAFDRKMTARFGKNYTKTRNIAIGVGKFFVAGQFGGAGMLTLLAYNAVKAVDPMMKIAERQRQEGRVTGILTSSENTPNKARRRFWRLRWAFRRSPAVWRARPARNWRRARERRR